MEEEVKVCPNCGISEEKEGEIKKNSRNFKKMYL